MPRTQPPLKPKKRTLADGNKLSIEEITFVDPLLSVLQCRPEYMTPTPLVTPVEPDPDYP